MTEPLAVLGTDDVLPAGDYYLRTRIRINFRCLTHYSGRHVFKYPIYANDNEVERCVLDICEAQNRTLSRSPRFP